MNAWTWIIGEYYRRFYSYRDWEYLEEDDESDDE